MESKFMTSSKFHLVNDTGLSLNIYYVDEQDGPITKPPSDAEIDLTASHLTKPGHEIPDYLENVDFDDDGCIDVSIVAFERNFEDPERDGRFVARIPAGTCWEPDARRLFTLERG